MSESRIRTFIAVELCDDAKAEAGLLISAVEKMGIHGVRAVRPRGIHLTLRFLGDIDRDAVPGVIAAIRAAASRSHPFDLALGDVGAFPNPGRQEFYGLASMVTLAAWVSCERALRTSCPARGSDAKSDVSTRTLRSPGFATGLQAQTVGESSGLSQA